MADKKAAPADPFDELKFYLYILVGIAVVWFLAGGYDDMVARGGPFLRPPSPISSGTSYGPDLLKLGIGGTLTISKSNISEHNGKLQLTDPNGPRKIGPSNEYAKVYAPLSNREPVTVTGMRIAGSPDGGDYTIGKGIKLLQGHVLDSNSAIKLSPGETLYAVTGTTIEIPLSVYDSTYPVWIFNANFQTEVWPQSGSIVLLDEDNSIVDTLNY